MHTVYLALGSNQGDRSALIKQAIELIARQCGPIETIAPTIETAPVGFQSEHPFLNTALCLHTSLTPIELLEQTQHIERHMGRKIKSSPKAGYADRPIDIDILLYDDLIMQSERLTIPHPLMHERLFVIEPLRAIAPELTIPTTQRTVDDTYHLLTL